MAEFTLPKASQPTKGKTWPKPAGTRLREYRVYRFDPRDASLLFAISWVALFLGILTILYRRNIIVKL